MHKTHPPTFTDVICKKQNDGTYIYYHSAEGSNTLVIENHLGEITLEVYEDA